MGGRAAAFAAPGLWPPRAGPTPRPVATVWLQRGIRRMPSAPILAAWHVVRPYTCRVSPPPVRCPFRRRGAPSLGLAPHNPARPQNPRGSCRVPPRRVPALETRDRRVQRARRLAARAPARRTPAARGGRARGAPLGPPLPPYPGGTRRRGGAQGVVSVLAPLYVKQGGRGGARWRGCPRCTVNRRRGAPAWLGITPPPLSAL